MRHPFTHPFGSRGRHFLPSDHRHSGGPGPHAHGPHDRPGGPRRRARPFDYGDLRLIVLAMIAETPRHGYELMKAIEARMGGGYSPSPGVIYPTLSWLEDMGYAAGEAEGGRRSYRITPEGAAFLAANREPLAALTARMGAPQPSHDSPEAVMQAMGALKHALRARFARGPVDTATASTIAAAIRAVAETVEQTMTDNPRSDAGERLASTATVTTPKAAGYAAQLAKHFAHKLPAHFEAGRGEVEFPFGTCTLAAEADRLTLRAEAADPDALARTEEVVASHLLRFAFREELTVDWQRD